MLFDHRDCTLESAPHSRNSRGAFCLRTSMFSALILYGLCADTFTCSTTCRRACAQPPSNASSKVNASPALTPSDHQDATRDAQNSSITWWQSDDCPVLLEKTVEVPALESGVLNRIEVALNSTVTAGQTLGQLDEDLAVMEVKIAQLQHAAAKELANDDSEVKFARVALRGAQQELDNHKAIQASVAGSELRRLSLAVGHAEVTVQRAEHAAKRLAVDAELKAATLQAANLRLSRRRIVSPLNGIVTAIHLHEGQWVEAGKPVALVVDLEQLLVDCLIPIHKVDLQRLVGLEVRVETARTNSGGAPVRLAGKISSYDPQVSSQGMIRVHARIQNARQGQHWLLLPGMNVKLEVAMPSGEPALISRQPATTTLEALRRRPPHPSR
jgi:multidrug efflux pump subunit AcrA (membrane-fusion protein)